MTEKEILSRIGVDPVIGDDVGERNTVNSEVDRAMTTDYLISIVNENDKDHFWLQKNGGTNHGDRAKIDLLTPLSADNKI